MRAIYNLKTINFESSAPIIKKIVGTYFSFLFILFLITALICLNNFKQIFLEEHAIKITIIISITFILISCILILILWIILKKIISPLIKLVTHSKNSDSLHEIEIPENISSEIIELYKITNESIARINEYQSKKIENEKNMAIAMTTQMLAHDVRKPFYLLKTTLKLLSQTKDPSKINDLINETIPEIDRTIKKVEGLLKDILEIGRTDGNLILAAIDPEVSSQ